MEAPRPTIEAPRPEIDRERRAEPDEGNQDRSEQGTEPEGHHHAHAEGGDETSSDAPWWENALTITLALAVLGFLMAKQIRDRRKRNDTVG
jgi:hypothetical protein